MNRFNSNAAAAAARRDALCALVVNEIETTLKLTRASNDVWERAVLYEAALLRIRRIAADAKINLPAA